MTKRQGQGVLVDELGLRSERLGPLPIINHFIDRIDLDCILDRFVPTTDGRELVLTRYTEPERELKLLLERLNLELPAQPPPRITTAQADAATSV
jgi:hypothetical protein